MPQYAEPRFGFWGSADSGLRFESPHHSGPNDPVRPLVPECLCFPSVMHNECLWIRFQNPVPLTLICPVTAQKLLSSLRRQVCEAHFSRCFSSLALLLSELWIETHHMLVSLLVL
eukprot:6490710-Amphidinium_carterae.1